MENPMNKWMIWGETPLFLETPTWKHLGFSFPVETFRPCQMWSDCVAACFVSPTSATGEGEPPWDLNLFANSYAKKQHRKLPQKRCQDFWKLKETPHKSPHFKDVFFCFDKNPHFFIRHPIQPTWNFPLFEARDWATSSERRCNSSLFTAGFGIVVPQACTKNRPPKQPGRLDLEGSKWVFKYTGVLSQDFGMLQKSSV